MKENVFPSKINLILRGVLFCLAALNFYNVWRLSRVYEFIDCVSCPWYEGWNITNEPSLLLAAAILLLMPTFWTDIAAAVLSGAVFLTGIALISSIFLHSGPYAWFSYVSAYPMDGRVGEFFAFHREFQCLLGLLILSFSIHYVRKSAKKTPRVKQQS